MASLRRLVLVLMAILTRPWTWLVLAGFPFQVFLAYGLLSHVMSTRASLTPVAVVSGPTVPRNGGADLREDQLATITDWYAIDPSVYVAVPGGVKDIAHGERLGDWDALDRFPALERLWMTAPAAVSGEGWRRIGDRAHLELLSLRNVGASTGVGDDAFARDGREALARLSRLKQLQLRIPDPDAAILLPPLPPLEACGIGWIHLEENLTTLAAGSPQLNTLAVETYPAFEFTPGMLAALQQMPALHTVYVAAAFRPDDEPAMARQVTELGRALPQVRVRPGTYSAPRVAAVGVAAVALATISFVFWFQAATLLATPLGWMLPRRFPPHAFWPIAVAAAGSGAFFVICQSRGVASLPALGLAMMAVGSGLYGPVFTDVAGWPARGTRLSIAASYAGRLLIGGTFLGAPVTADRWLMGHEPAAAVALVVVAAAELAWKMARVARLPRVVAEGGREAAIISVMAGWQTAAWGAADRAGRADRRSWPDAAIDWQLARPLPTATSAATAFAEMLRRPQGGMWIGIMVGSMLGSVGSSAVFGIQYASGTVSWPQAKGLAAMLACFLVCQSPAIATAVMWWQRHESLALDFLRPVSRRDYWLGLRQAIARDLTVPLAVVALGLAASASWWGHGHMLPWFVSAAAFGGLVAAAHTAFLLIATGCRPLIAATIAVIVLFFTAAGLVGAVRESLLYAVDRDATHRWWAMATAIVVLGAGLATRAAVLWKLEDREVG
jgi:hypothetical protein